jgi:hypothetical protein
MMARYRAWATHHRTRWAARARRGWPAWALLWTALSALAAWPPAALWAGGLAAGLTAAALGAIAVTGGTGFARCRAEAAGTGGGLLALPVLVRWTFAALTGRPFAAAPLALLWLGATLTGALALWLVGG